MAKIPFLLLVGDQEIEKKGVYVRTRSGDQPGFMSIEQLKQEYLSTT